MLARLSSRRGEIAVRAALGAGRLQLVRQVLAESLVLSFIGGALGLIVAWAGVRLVHTLPEGSLPRMQDVRLDGGVLLFALAISVARRAGLRPRSRLPGVARRPSRHDERILRSTREFGRSSAERAGRRRGRARADAAGRRRADDSQLRAADARIAGIRAGQPAGRADLSAAVEVPHGDRPHAVLHGYDQPRRRAPGCAIPLPASARCRCTRSASTTRCRSPSMDTQRPPTARSHAPTSGPRRRAISKR